jgi:CO/xanthine dehydrogenase Mo-binding subunit
VTTLPASLRDTPRLDRWLAFPPGCVRLSVGKVELGQGIATALAQIAADELDVAPGRIDVRAGDTDATPDEGVTSSSLSIEVSGGAVRQASAEVRALLLAEAARRLNCAPADLTVEDGALLRGGEATGQDWWTLAPHVPLARDATGAATPKPTETLRVVGRDVPRVDLPAKMFGGGFVHDLLPAGVLHARVLRQPSPGAVLAELDAAAVGRHGAELVRIGNFAAVLAEDETAAAAAHAAATPRWEGVASVSPTEGEAAALCATPSTEILVGEPHPPAAGRHAATFSRGYVSHGSLGPSCAVSEYRDGRMTVWTHSRGVYPLRATLAGATGLAPEAIAVRYVPGSGGYGAAGAEDAAADAAVLALARPGRPVRVLWRREDEFAFEHLGPAMAIRLEAGLDEAGRPVAWSAEIWSFSHVLRGAPPLARLAMPDPPPLPPAFEPPPSLGGGATRNAISLYDVGPTFIRLHLVDRGGVRTGALRSLGGLPNVFATEMFLDELAEAAGQDPVAYRLALLSDPRARRVVEHVASMAGWQTRGPGGGGQGMGIGFARYKNRSGYAAVVAAVSVEQEVRLEKIWCAADCGLAINPDGVRNQLEGGIVQAASMTLKERVSFAGSGVASVTWADYPILRFSEVPEIDVELVGARENPPLGVGEATMGPTAAAIGNAVAHALGARIRDLPLTRARIAATLLA